MNENSIKNSIKKIDDYIHDIDPLGLGGATGEYSDVVFNIYKISKEKIGEITTDQIKNSFNDIFGELTKNLTLEDLNSIKNFVEKIIASEK